MQNRKLRFVILLAVLMISGFLFTSFISYFTANESIRSQVAKTTLPLTSDNIYSEIQRDLLRPISIASMMANDTFVRDWILNGEQDEQAMIKYLSSIQTHFNTVTSFFVSDKSLAYYHSSGKLRAVDPLIPHDKWYFRVQTMPQEYEINIDVDSADLSSFVVFINFRMFDYSGHYIGAIGVGLGLDRVQKLIENYNSRYDREVYFINKSGEIMLQGQSKHNYKNIHQIPGLSTFATQILTSPSNSITYQQDNEKYYLNSRLVPQFGWYLIVSQQQQEAEQRIQNTLLLNLAISFVVSIIILILVNFIISGYQKKLETMATTDKLTGSANRQVFDVLFQQVYNQSKRNKTPLSALMLDLDYFKQINDTYGHPTGDVVLKTLIQSIKANLRESDIIFRWGGEEFLIILPESDLQSAYEIAEEIRIKSADLNIIFAGKSVSITISIGVACMTKSDTHDTLINHTDEALYLAKERGRNRTERYLPHSNKEIDK
ncbi:GGDEF domain-containing protein [Psychromonas sp. RZ22]|uniref:sensor domain-containing diguanylate cyclase n=1 Tax=Psychromonas algarum TaxID=2555643 RepID=UPI001067FB0C|nr:sensor domain-containing diguanylate cyclase [Psychromonas sp. RZ22]TEW54695.1 GGDEF domain-containing protein [Psychromonas sp. RZ22]